MKKIFWFLASYVIVLGVIGYSLTFITGDSAISFIEINQNINGITYYKFNLFNYINNINKSIGDVSRLVLEAPTREWKSGDFLKVFENNFYLAIDWIIYAMNILIYPLRVGGYFLKQIIVLVGIPIDTTQTHALKWLVNLVNRMQELQIPYL